MVVSIILGTMVIMITVFLVVAIMIMIMAVVIMIMYGHHVAVVFEVFMVVIAVLLL